jgi:puromycin-sensitive aminopeptidase
MPKDAVTETPTDPYRLPRTVVPIRYDLTLEPDLGAGTFAGSVTTTVEVNDETTTIVLNAVELEIDEAWVDAGGTRLEAAGIELDETTERLTVRLTAPLTAGSADLHLRFRGVLNDKLKGFYRSTFTDTEGNDQVIATTQFEATDARRAFPCWDEPEMKASFAVTLVVDPDLAAISNAQEIARSARDDGKLVVQFADTMKMSTYLVAFIVGPLDVTAPVDVDNTPLRIVYPRGKGHLTDYALEVGAFCLRFFADYYGIVYPGDKLDLVAVPDFAFGAMENLGCVTFREVLLLVDPDEVTQPELQNVTDVIAHELAHMWFGDLVTMKWWNGIWLNEAFATFMEMLATDAFRPEWDRWVSFGLSRSAAFDVDALKSTRPIEYPVESPEDAEGMFDILTYEKGAAVVRMLEQYLEAEPFRAGIRSYLSKHQYENTETTDLWDAIEEATGEPVRRMMDSWIFQGGFPVVDVDLVDDGGTIRLTQERFGYAGDLGEGDEDLDRLDETRWIVPVILTIAMNGVVTVERVLIEGDSVDVPVVEEIDWLLVNTEGTGFYRVRYAPDLLAALTSRAQTELSPIERYGLVDDMWAAVLAADATTVDFLELAESFGDETDLSVWQRLVGGLGSIDRLVDGDARAFFQERLRTLLRPALDRLGTAPLADESDRDRELRGVLFEALGVLGDDAPTIDAARDLYARDKAGDAVDPSLLAAAVRIVASHGSAADFDEFVTRFQNAPTPQEELRFLSVLADFDDPELVRRLLRMSITDEVRTQNAPYLLRRALSNREQGALAWLFVQDEWDTINSRFPSNSIVRMLEGVRSLSAPAVAPEVFVFFETHEVPQGDKILAQHLERLEVNVALRSRESERLAHHLR